MTPMLFWTDSWDPGDIALGNSNDNRHICVDKCTDAFEAGRCIAVQASLPRAPLALRGVQNTWLSWRCVNTQIPVLILNNSVSQSMREEKWWSDLEDGNLLSWLLRSFSGPCLYAARSYQKKNKG